MRRVESGLAAIIAATLLLMGCQQHGVLPTGPDFGTDATRAVRREGGIDDRAGNVPVAVAASAWMTLVQRRAALPAPTLTAVSPVSGPTAGGTLVTLTGNNFTGATSVTFGGAAGTGLTVVTNTTITVTTPAGAAGAVAVAISTGSGTATLAASYTYSVAAAPTLTSVSPVSGPTTGGTLVTLTGTNFTGATGVTFGGVAGTGLTVVNATTITVTTPAGTAGAVAVAVSTGGGTATLAASYTYTAPAPTLTAVSPPNGPLGGGTLVTLTGTNFTGASGVTFGGVAGTGLTVVNPTTITVTAPAGSVGAKAVAVTTGGGTATLAGSYTYMAIPTITGFSPVSGPAAGGTLVTITGTNFTGATLVQFGGYSGSGMTVVNPTTITVTTPNVGSAYTNRVFVTTPGGTGSSAANYTFVMPAPTVTSVSPASGSTMGGDTVTVTGTNFIGVTSMSMGGVQAITSYVVVNATTITFTTPAQGVGSNAIGVTTGGGTGWGGTFDYVAPAGLPATFNWLDGLHFSNTANDGNSDFGVFYADVDVNTPTSTSYFQLKSSAGVYTPEIFVDGQPANGVIPVGGHHLEFWIRPDCQDLDFGAENPWILICNGSQIGSPEFGAGGRANNSGTCSAGNVVFADPNLYDKGPGSDGNGDYHAFTQSYNVHVPVSASSFQIRDGMGTFYPVEVMLGDSSQPAMNVIPVGFQQIYFRLRAPGCTPLDVGANSPWTMWVNGVRNSNALFVGGILNRVGGCP